MNLKLITACAALMMTFGCNVLPFREEPRYVDPALPMTLSRNELVDYLNNQHQGLRSWRDMDMTLQVRLPNGISQRLSGMIACEAPGHFRLTARQAIILAKADLGANAERCWVYVKPGEDAILTWRHEDAELLQHMPMEIPRIDPEWLMVVLGVTPLQHEDFEVSRAPTGDRELWLTAIEDNYDGRPLRRVIKVDTVRGVVCEHAVYDSERNPLVRARLSRYRSINGHQLPHTVKLEFPQLDTILTLSFNRIQTGCHLKDELWQLPSYPDARVVDLGAVVRQQMQAGRLSRPAGPPGRPHASPDRSGRSLTLQPPQFHHSVPPEFAAWSTTPRSPADTRDSREWADNAAPRAPREPVWDEPSAVRTVSNEQSAPVFDESPSPPPRRSAWWQWPWRRSR